MVAVYRLKRKVVYKGYEVINSVMQVDYANGRSMVYDSCSYLDKSMGRNHPSAPPFDLVAKTEVRTDSYPVEIQSVLIVRDQQGNVSSLQPETYHPKVLDSDFDVIHSLEVL